MFTVFWVKVTVEIGGKMAVRADVKSLRVEHYTGHLDSIRLGFECTFLVLLVIDFLLEALDLCENFKVYFKLLGNYLDLGAILLMSTGVVLW